MSILSKVDKNRRIRTKNMQCHSPVLRLISVSDSTEGAGLGSGWSGRHSAAQLRAAEKLPLRDCCPVLHRSHEPEVSPCQSKGNLIMLTIIVMIVLWEKTELLNSGLDASFFGDAWWSRAQHVCWPRPTTQVRVPTWPDGFFQWCFMTKYCYIYIYIYNQRCFVIVSSG